MRGTYFYLQKTQNQVNLQDNLRWTTLNQN